MAHEQEWSGHTYVDEDWYGHDLGGAVYRDFTFRDARSSTAPCAR